MTQQKETRVVAGIIVEGDKVLLGRRLATGKYPHQWEFPGGKSEPGETPPETLRRELQEELGMSAKIDRKIIMYEYTYPNRHRVDLSFFLVTEFEPEPQKIHYNELHWVAVERLQEYDILEGSRPVVEYLVSHAEEIFYAG